MLLSTCIYLLNKRMISYYLWVLNYKYLVQFYTLAYIVSSNFDIKTFRILKQRTHDAYISSNMNLQIHSFMQLFSTEPLYYCPMLNKTTNSRHIAVSLVVRNTIVSGWEPTLGESLVAFQLSQSSNSYLCFHTCSMPFVSDFY